MTLAFGHVDFEVPVGPDTEISVRYIARKLRRVVQRRDVHLESLGCYYLVDSTGLNEVT